MNRFCIFFHVCQKHGCETYHQGCEPYVWASKVDIFGGKNQLNGDLMVVKTLEILRFYQKCV